MTVYLDYNATTPLDPAVRQAMLPMLEGNFANPSSFHRLGQNSRHAVEAARESLASFFGVEPGDFIFTSGATEANNLAIKGVLDSLSAKRSQLVLSSIEHQSVLHPAQDWVKKGGSVVIVPVNPAGFVDLTALKEAVNDKTALVSLMHVNNEIGTIQPIDQAAKMAHDRGALFHVDAVQSVGKLNLDLAQTPIDLLSFSAHKIYGPKGVGALCIRKGVKLKSQIQGGHQEKNIRPGTENVIGIVGFGAAVALLNDSEKRQIERRRVEALRDKLYEGIKQKISGVKVNGDLEHSVYNTLNVSFEGLDGETLLMNLDLKGICVSTGSACTAGSIEPSHVLLALGRSDSLARSAIRFSVGRFSEQADIDEVLKHLPNIVEHLRKHRTQ